MTAQEFIEQEYGNSYFNPEPEDVFQLMTQYARLMCDKQKEICANNAVFKDLNSVQIEDQTLSFVSITVTDEMINNEICFVINMEETLNAPYPEELL